MDVIFLDPQKIVELSDKITKQITTSNKTLLSIFPIKKYVDYIQKYPKISEYGYVGQEVKDFCKGIVSLSSEQMLDAYHQLVLMNLLLNAPKTLEKSNLSEEIKILYNANFERITKEIESKDHIGLFTYTNDKFRKDLAVCSLRMIPAGAQKINVAGISRRFLLKKGLSQFIKGIMFALFELGGFHPLYEMHTDFNDPALMADFNEDGWIKFYRRVSELLKVEPDVRGIFGGSWFFDPKLEKISPRLVYLRKIVTDNGGKLFYLGHSSQSIEDATLKSPTRRRLYEEKKYMPTSYLLIWSRKKLISWADRIK